MSPLTVLKVSWKFCFREADRKRQLFFSECTGGLYGRGTIQLKTVRFTSLPILFCHFNLSYTVASVLSFWEQTFFTGIGKTIELVFLFSVAVPHSNCNDHGYESVFDESELRLKEKCICIFLAGPCYVLWMRWCKISITIAPVKRIRTTCMLKPKTHPHLCDNSEQHESKGGNAYVFLFVFSACAFWWDLSVSHATRNTLISMFLVTLWRRAGAQK